MCRMLSLSRERIMGIMLVLLATIATVVAQTTSFSCMAFTFEQPRLPQSLIREE